MFHHPRGGFRGRGRGSRLRATAPSFTPFRPTPPEVSAIPSRDIMEGLLDTPVINFEIPLTPGNSDSTIATISEVKYVGSYNWLEEDCTIVTPGAPGMWLDKPTPYTLEADKDEQFRDQNAFRVPTAPLLPLVAVVDAYVEATEARLFDWSSVDILTDRSSLRKLLRWIRENADKDFRIDVQLAGKKTVMFGQWEPTTKEPPLYQGHTFGRSFEAYTTKDAFPGCKGSTGHRRIIQYDFGGLKMVVRSELDAYIPSSRSTSTLDDIVKGIRHTTISDDTQVITAGDTALNLKMQKGGLVVPQSSTVEIASVSQYRWNNGHYDWDEAMIQVVLSQVPHLFLGIHHRGNFSEVRKYSEDSPEWKNAMRRIQGSLMKLRMVLDKIISFIVDQGDEARWSLVCQKGKLVMYKKENSDYNLLPTDFLDEFL